MVQVSAGRDDPDRLGRLQTTRRDHSYSDARRSRYSLGHAAAPVHAWIDRDYRTIRICKLDLETGGVDRPRPDAIALGQLIHRVRTVDSFGKIPGNVQRHREANPGEQVNLARIAELFFRVVAAAA